MAHGVWVSMGFGKYNGKSSQNHLQADRIGEIVRLTFRCFYAIVCYAVPTLLELIPQFLSATVVVVIVVHNQNGFLKWSTVFFTFRMLCSTIAVSTFLPLSVVVVVIVVVAREKIYKCTISRWGALCTLLFGYHQYFIGMCAFAFTFNQRSIHHISKSFLSLYSFFCSLCSSSLSLSQSKCCALTSVPNIYLMA